MTVKKSNKRTLIILVGVTLLMFAFGFALVPIYNVVCKQLGINGKPTTYAVANNQKPDLSRWVTVQFVASTNEYLPWKFYPLVKSVKVHPGQNEQLAFYAKNDSSHTMTVQAIPSITPGQAAKYFLKTECFCFTQQTFKAGESRDMPLIFHIDTNLPQSIHTITLSYTMFDAEKYKKTA